MTFNASAWKCVILLLSALIWRSFAVTKPPPSPIRAVNLGGWLVTEGWMTPWLFPGGIQPAPEKLREHWNTYIQEGDFLLMSQHGINAVRIPVGYWIIQDNPPSPFVGGSLQFLDKAFDWAEKHNIGVIVDLHAAPGSQNGKEHSGSRDGSQNWGKTDENIRQTVAVIDFLTSRYAQRSGLLAMELINEPLAPGVEINRLKQYYQAGYDAVRKYSNCYVIFSNRLGPHDETELLDFASRLHNTVIDVHYYNLNSGFFTRKNLQENIDYVYNDRAADINYLSRPNGPLLFIGEWTAALAQSNDDEARAFGKAQLDVFGRASFGWAFWSYKNKNNPQWSMKHLLTNGILKLK